LVDVTAVSDNVEERFVVKYAVFGAAQRSSLLAVWIRMKRKHM